jgi:ribonuclease Z
MQLYFLGTGAGMPSKQRNVSALVLNLQEEIGQCWLFDCGEGTQHQLLRAPIKLNKISRLFVTHLHGDHIFGIPGMLTSRSNQGGEEPFTIHGPKGIREFVETSLSVSASHLRFELQFAEFAEGPFQTSRIHEDERFEVSAAMLDHRMDSYGFRIMEKDRAGSLDAAQLKALGLAPGPIYGKLKAGGVAQLPDGTTIDGRTLIGPPIRGRIAAVLGDTRECPAALDLAYNADVLVHEATFASDKQELAEQFYHSTSVQAARLAAKANARTLILNHISPRYQDGEEQILLDEAKKVFFDTHLAWDQWEFTLERR